MSKRKLVVLGLVVGLGSLAALAAKLRGSGTEGDTHVTGSWADDIRSVGHGSPVSDRTSPKHSSGSPTTSSPIGSVPPGGGAGSDGHIDSDD